MNKEWVMQKNKEAQEQVDAAKNHLFGIINSFDCISEEYCECHAKLMNGYGDILTTIRFLFFLATGKFGNELDTYIEGTGVKADIEILSKYFYYRNINEPVDYYDRYLDGDWVDFDGTIIITDPCYLESATLQNGERREIENLYNLGEVGFNPFISVNTIYGDWSCHTFLRDKEEAIGEFCADAGMVCVVLKKDLDAFNPNCELKDFVATTIPNFKGHVRTVISEKDYSFTSNDGKVISGKDYSLSIVGEGVDSVTGERLDFYTMQTGL